MRSRYQLPGDNMAHDAKDFERTCKRNAILDAIDEIRNREHALAKVMDNGKSIYVQATGWREEQMHLIRQRLYAKREAYADAIIILRDIVQKY